jgi:Ni/Co efflux regulator RcnB
METDSSPRIKVLAPLWALVLGAIGFGCGFVGPIMLAPEANQGPLLGIFIAGPGGLVLGFLLGVVACLLPLSGRARRGILLIAGVTVATVTLYFSTPSPAYVGRVIDAEITECTTPAAALPAAIERWQATIAKVSWATPRAGWQAGAERLAQTDPGVVLALRVHRERAIRENRKPWNKGSVLPSAWRASGEIKHYYARHAGGACANYALGKREVYFPVSEREAEGAWPSLALPNFLGLQVLGPVPEKYRVLPGDAG